MRTIDKIRDLLKLGTVHKFYAEARLDDGRLVVTEAEAMDIGVEVFVMNEEGQAEVVPDGEYMLEDGTKLVVAGGRIAQLGEEAPVVEAGKDKEEMGDEYGDMRKKLAEIGLEDDLVEKVVEIIQALKPEAPEGEVEAMNEAITEMAAQTAKHLKTLMSRIEALENQPATAGVKHTPAKQATKSQPQVFSSAWETALYQINQAKHY